MHRSARLLPFVVLAFTSTAFGQILNSKHDLRATSTGPDAANRITGLTEICLPCHTPHKADTTISEAPLWNHQLTSQTFGTYTTLQGSSANVNGASKLCLSCHDGVTAMDNYGGNTTGTDAMVDPSGSSPVLGLPLNNDHPIGVDYPPPAGSFATAAVVIAAGLRLPELAAQKRVECQSCHEPHDGSATKFLRIDNAGSTLCTTCHTL